MANEIKPEQVPDAAMNALLLALRLRKGGKEAIAAALNAWPGMQTGSDDGGITLSGIYIPITETPDDKA